MFIEVLILGDLADLSSPQVYHRLVETILVL